MFQFATYKQDTQTDSTIIHRMRNIQQERVLQHFFHLHLNLHKPLITHGLNEHGDAPGFY